MGLFQIEWRMNVGIENYVCVGVGQEMFRIQCLMLANSNTYMKEREGHKAGKADYVQIETGHSMEQKGTLVPEPGMGGACVEAGVQGESLEDCRESAR